mgnify:CR=1 FL=1
MKECVIMNYDNEITVEVNTNINNLIKILESKGFKLNKLTI